MCELIKLILCEECFTHSEKVLFCYLVACWRLRYEEFESQDNIAKKLGLSAATFKLAWARGLDMHMYRRLRDDSDRAIGMEMYPSQEWRLTQRA